MSQLPQVISLIVYSQSGNPPVALRLKVEVNTIVPRSPFLLFVPQNTDCYKHKIKCGRMSASMKWRYLGHLQLLSKAKHSFMVMAKKKVCPRDEIADPPGTAVLPVDIHDFAKRFGIFLYAVWCAIVAVAICSELSDYLGPTTAAGTVRDSVFQPCVLLSWVLMLDDVALLHLIVKGIVTSCIGAMAETVCGALRTAVAVFAHWMCTIYLVQKPVSAAQMQFTHATRNPRARQIAGRVVCWSKVDIV